MFRSTQSPVSSNPSQENADRLFGAGSRVADAFRRLHIRFRVAFVLGLLLFTDRALLAADRIELTQLVPRDVGLALEVRGLTDQAKVLIQSSLVQRIQQHSAWQQVLKSSEIAKLKEVDQGVRHVTQRSLVEWLDTVLGREAILAISPHAESAEGSDDSEQLQLIFLTRLKNRDDLKAILAAWAKLDERQESKHEHRGHEYFSRIKSDDTANSVHYVLIDDVLVMSDRASAITTVLDLFKGIGAADAGNLASSVRFQKTSQLLNPAATIRLFVQPTVWKRAIPADENGERDAVARLIRRAWEESQSIGVGIRFESGIIAEAVVLSDELAKNPKWRHFVERTSGAPAFLARVPRTALVAFAGRHDFNAFSEWGLTQLSAEQVKKLKSVRQMIRGILLGRDLLDDILPELPADFGGFIVPRGQLDLKAAPVDGLLAVSLPAKEAVDAPPAKPPFRGALNNAAQTGFSMLTALYNSSTNGDAELKDEDVNGVSIHWINSLGPYQPAYAVADDYLLLSSSPQLIRDFLKQSTTETWAADADLRKFREACFADASQVLALQGRLARDFVGQHREFFVQQLVSSHKLNRGEATKRLDRMLEWVQLSDAVVIATTFSVDHVKLVVGIAVEGTPDKK